MDDRDIIIPETISDAAKQALQELAAAQIYKTVMPKLDDEDAWRAVSNLYDDSQKEAAQAALNNTGVGVTETTLADIPVLDIRPPGWTDNGRVLLYVHGGAYVVNSARSSLMLSAPMSVTSGLRTISVDYTLAPFANWRVMQDQVIAVFEGLLAQGIEARNIAMLGESAGGGLLTSSILTLRDRGVGVPACVALWSPWVDLSNTGDTYQTLAEADPMLSYTTLGDAAVAYADGLELRDPRISPVYASFDKGFPPTLIQVGTKEIFLSEAVRLYQKLDAVGQTTKLDVFEGMWHVFQMQSSPEADLAMAKSAKFISEQFSSS
ncbi:MAG: alpha/beta hydrolase [Pseudomonadota bacterium]